MSAEKQYKQRLQQRQAEAERLHRIDRWISVGRLVSFLTGTVIVVRDLAGWGSAGLFWMVAPFVVFAALAVWHAMVLKRRREFERRIAFYQRCLARVEDRWIGKGPDGVGFASPDHPYAFDLDVVGDGGLFQRIWISGTSSGARTLADWMLNPTDAETIRLRQEAVQEARDALDFREELALFDGGTLDSDFTQLCGWGSKNSSCNLGVWRVGTWLLSMLTVAAGLAWWLWDLSAIPFFILVALELILGLRFRSLRSDVRQQCGDLGRSLHGFNAVLARLEHSPFQSTLFKQWMEALTVDKGTASKTVSRLQLWLDMLEGGRNQFLALLSPLLLWETQCALAIEAWRQEHGNRISGWIKGVGRIEAILAVAGYAYESENPVFPEVTEDELCYSGKELRHPLMPAAQCVPNDIRLDAETRIWMVSGSNMSGKSTWLRTLGLNLVLLHLGANVQAAVMRSSPFVIGASIRILDSVHEGVSRFYREIKRLKQVSDLVEGPQPLLFLLDEILHGTNSADRLTGVEAFVDSMKGRNAAGLITTHDLALSEISDESTVRNWHFRSDVKSGELLFDYKVHPGVVTESNALVLMRQIGLLD